MLLLIDGDILIHTATAAAEREFEFQEDSFILTTNLADARDNFISLFQDILTKAGQEDYCLCLSDPKVNWRKSVYPQYKGNRKETRKPLGYYTFRNWVEHSYKVFQRPTLEADDVIGIMATKPGNKAIIWSKDKDLRQIPGLHLSTKDDGGPLLTEVSEAEGDYFHMFQTLTGDQVDGYPGCPGVGKVTAEKLLDVEPFYHWAKITTAYEKKGLTEADALVQAQIARILRWSDWDSANQKVKLWKP